jgi:hypothetical protein
MNFQPDYLQLLATGELERRVHALEALLARCTVCPRNCFNNRLQNEIAACYSERLPVVSSYTQHFGEEPALVGTRGAGNIFSATVIAEANPSVSMTYGRLVSLCTGVALVFAAFSLCNNR